MRMVIISNDRDHIAVHEYFPILRPNCKSTMWDFIKKLFGFQARVDVLPFLKEGSDILDVRTEKEYAEGHIKGSVNIPLDQLGKRLGEVRKLKQPIIAVCRSGRRSGLATKQLKRAGLHVHNGGGWHEVADLIK